MTNAIGPFPRPFDERSLYHRNIQFGFDGSLVLDDMYVYVLGNYRGLREVYNFGVQQMDYFGGLIDGVAIYAR